VIFSLDKFRLFLESKKYILCSRILEDKYLTYISHLYSSHHFLGNSIQGVFSRQVKFLSALITEITGDNFTCYKVLDWGCGKGQISYLLKKEKLNITSCDLMVDNKDSSFGQETPIILENNIEVAPLIHPSILPFDDAVFDCVVSFGVLEHVKDDLYSMQEVRRVLRANGLFVINFLPYKLSWTQALAHLRGNFYHDRLYWKSDVLWMAESSSFQVVSINFAQLFPKNSIPFRFDLFLEPIDRFLCKYTPLKFFATNLEVVLVAT